MQLCMSENEAVVTLSREFSDAGCCVGWPVQFRWIGPDFRFVRSERGNDVLVRLVRLGGVDAPESVSVQADGDRLHVDLGLPAVSAWLEMSVDGPRLMRQLNAPSAPREWIWEISCDEHAPPLRLLTRGRDNVWGYATRSSDRDRSRLLDVRSTVAMRVSNGKRVAEVREAWSGLVFARDAMTRVPRLTKDATFPVYFDPTWGPTLIQSGAGDGYEASGVWNTGANSIYVGTAFGGAYGGWRWTGVTVPQGSTINSATLGLRVLEDYGTSKGKFYGDDVDNSAALANTAGGKVSGRTKTTASAVFTPAGTGDKTLDVTSIVQEIVDRAGWASGNAMTFIGAPNADNWMRIQDYYQVPGNANRATLTIDYTEPSSAPVISSVTISGTSQIGSTLTASVTTDQDPVDSTAFQWEKASDGSGTGAADLSGETSSTLALTYADFGDLLDTGAYVRVGAIATKSPGGASAEAFSAWQQVTAPSGGVSGSPLKSPFLIA